MILMEEHAGTRDERLMYAMWWESLEDVQDQTVGEVCSITGCVTKVPKSNYPMVFHSIMQAVEVNPCQMIHGDSPLSSEANVLKVFF